MKNKIALIMFVPGLVFAETCAQSLSNYQVDQFGETIWFDAESEARAEQKRTRFELATRFIQTLDDDSIEKGMLERLEGRTPVNDGLDTSRNLTIRNHLMRAYDFGIDVDGLQRELKSGTDGPITSQYRERFQSSVKEQAEALN